MSVDGICSTAVCIGRNYFDVAYMPETFSKTTAKSFRKGGIVNLERPLSWRASIDGHFVLGHVDARARVVRVEKSGRSAMFTLSAPRKIADYVVPRGSVALNGVSLTVAKKEGRYSFKVGLIPQTLSTTNLGIISSGGEVNIETDLLMRYLIERKKHDRVIHHAKKRVRKKDSAP